MSHLPANLDKLSWALGNRLSAICSAWSHAEARVVIREAIAATSPAHVDVDIEATAHYIDGEVGPAYRALLEQDGVTYTLFISIEFGCAAVTEGDRQPSYWS